MARWATADDATLARVMRVDRGLVVALSENGPVRAGLGGGLLSAMAREPEQGPCVGDWCRLRSWSDGRTTVDALLPRRTALVRAVAGDRGRERVGGEVLCANVDLAAVVVAVHPPTEAARLEELVALAETSGARPLMVRTGSDEVEELRTRLEGRLTLALLGASGHGQPGLVHALTGAFPLRTGEVRGPRRSSMANELIPLPGGGAVVDVPWSTRLPAQRDWRRRRHQSGRMRP